MGNVLGGFLSPNSYMNMSQAFQISCQIVFGRSEVPAYLHNVFDAVISVFPNKNVSADSDPIPIITYDVSFNWHQYN